MPALNDREIREHLAKLNGWNLDGNEIVREFKFGKFADGIEFVRKVAAEADAMDHHPDIDIRYTTVRLALTSHDTGGLTDRDFRLATKINTLT